jgi:hypothetical protein
MKGRKGRTDPGFGRSGTPARRSTSSRTLLPDSGSITIGVFPGPAEGCEMQRGEIVKKGLRGLSSRSTPAEPPLPQGPPNPHPPTSRRGGSPQGPHKQPPHRPAHRKSSPRQHFENRRPPQFDPYQPCNPIQLERPLIVAQLAMRHHHQLPPAPPNVQRLHNPLRVPARGNAIKSEVSSSVENSASNNLRNSASSAQSAAALLPIRAASWISICG